MDLNFNQAIEDCPICHAQVKASRYFDHMEWHKTLMVYVEDE